MLSVFAQYFFDIRRMLVEGKPDVTRAEKVSDSPERWEFEFPFVPAFYNELKGSA